MKLILMPSFAETAQNLGFDDLDDVDQDAVLFQQGRETEITEVEPGDVSMIFREPEGGSRGSISRLFHSASVRLPF